MNGVALFAPAWSKRLRWSVRGVRHFVALQWFRTWLSWVEMVALGTLAFAESRSNWQKLLLNKLTKARTAC